MPVRGFLFACLCLPLLAQAAQWRYQNYTDQMTGKAASQASVISDNSLSLSSPYAGRNHGSIVVRRHPTYGVDVLVMVDKGQLLCRPYGQCALSIRFDDGKPQRFTVVEPADHSSETLFITNRTRFITQAKKAKRILVQVPMYQEGEQVLEFSVPVELVWK